MYLKDFQIQVIDFFVKEFIPEGKNKIELHKKNILNNLLENNLIFVSSNLREDLIKNDLYINENYTSFENTFKYSVYLRNIKDFFYFNWYRN